MTCGRWTAALTATIRPRRASPGKLPVGIEKAFRNQLPDHRDELRMRSNRFGTDHIQTDPFGRFPGLVIQIKNHLHVIRQESDRHHNHVVDAIQLERFEMVADVRFQPGDVRWPAATLIDQFPAIVRQPQGLGGQAADFRELLHVITPIGHGIWNAVGCECDVVRVARLASKLGDRILQSVDVGFHEIWVVVEHQQLFNYRCRFTYGLLSRQDVLSILTTTGIGAVGGRHKRQSTADTVTCHLLHRVGEHRMPVSISPVNRQFDLMRIEFLLQGRDDITALRIDRANAAEQRIVFGHLEHSFSRNISSAEDIFEEREDIIGSFGTAE